MEATTFKSTTKTRTTEASLKELINISAGRVASISAAETAVGLQAFQGLSPAFICAT